MNPVTATRRLIRPSVALVLALCLPSSQAVAGRAARTRPQHASRPGVSSTHATGHATYGHSGGYHAHGHFYGYSWYPWLGYAFWPSWGMWYQPGPYLPNEPAGSPRRPALIEIDVHPGKAELHVDSEDAGEARDFNGRFDLLALKPGPHVLEFSRPGYQTLRRVIDAEANGYLRIDDRLAKGTGLDARSDEVPAEVAAEPSEDRVDVPDAGFPPERPRPQSPSASEQPGRLADGLLRVRVEPADAAVYLDGEFLARADELGRLHGALPVAQGIHSLEVVRPGFQSQSRRVDVQGEQPVTVEIELSRSGPAEIN